MNKIPIILYTKHYWIRAFDFEGISTRKEFWWAYLSSFIISLIIVTTTLTLTFQQFLVPNTLAPILTFWSIVNSVPATSIACRRLRDAGASIWWLAFPLASRAFKLMPEPLGNILRLLMFPVLIYLTVMLCRPTRFHQT